MNSKATTVFQSSLGTSEANNVQKQQLEMVSYPLFGPSSGHLFRLFRYVGDLEDIQYMFII